jgi:hypothetical protein
MELIRSVTNGDISTNNEVREILQVSAFRFTSMTVTFYLLLFQRSDDASHQRSALSASGLPAGTFIEFLKFLSVCLST